LMAIPPNCVALKLERELPLLVIILNLAEKSSPKEGPHRSPDSRDDVHRRD
jgi:hypothetical protein